MDCISWFDAFSFFTPFIVISCKMTSEEKTEDSVHNYYKSNHQVDQHGHDHYIAKN